MRQFTAELHSSGFLQKKASFACCFGVSGEQRAKSVLNSNWFALILNCIEPNTHERERKKKPGGVFVSLPTKITQAALWSGSAQERDVNFPVALHASIADWESWLLFCSALVSRSSSPERTGTSGITAAKPLLLVGFLFDDYIHVWVRDAHSRARERVRERAGVLRHSVSVTRLHRLRCSPLTGEIHFFYLSFMNFDQL